MPNQNSIVRLFTFALAVFVSSFSFAQVDGNTGAYSTSIGVRVPSHRGLEPNLALVYNSLGGNGMVGVGWSLTGFPTIERQGADGGSPQFDSTDSYRLGGEDLHLCGSSSSPGCLALGTHFAEHEMIYQGDFQLQNDGMIYNGWSTRNSLSQYFPANTDWWTQEYGPPDSGVHPNNGCRERLDLLAKARRGSCCRMP